MDAGQVTSLLVTVITNLGVAGILAWYLWFTQTVRLPQIEKTWRDALREMEVECHRATQQQRADFLAALQGQREALERAFHDSRPEKKP